MMNKPLSIIAVMMSIFTVSSALADHGNLNISGFGNIATATSDSSSYEFRNDRSQSESAKKDGVAFRPLSSIGVQLDYNISVISISLGNLFIETKTDRTLTPSHKWPF